MDNKRYTQNASLRSQSPTIKHITSYVPNNSSLFNSSFAQKPQLSSYNSNTTTTLQDSSSLLKPQSVSRSGSATKTKTQINYPDSGSRIQPENQRPPATIRCYTDAMGNVIRTINNDSSVLNAKTNKVATTMIGENNQLKNTNQGLNNSISNLNKE